MKNILYVFLMIASIIACKNNNSISSNKIEEAIADQSKNLLFGLSSNDLNDFNWMNEPEDFWISNGSLQVMAPKESDFFNDPFSGEVKATAPLLYIEVTGDFVAIAKVKPDFVSVWNGAALMLYKDSLNWAKLCFEFSDATGPSVVTVVTRKVSDDANGVIMNRQESLWLKLVRKDDLYAMHWSKNGEDYKMARLFRMPHFEKVKVGMEAQSPIGENVTHEFLFFSLEQRTVKDLRVGE